MTQSRIKPFPYAKAAGLVRLGRNNISEMVENAKYYYDLCLTMESELISLKNEINILKSENDCLLETIDGP